MLEKVDGIVQGGVGEGGGGGEPQLLTGDSGKASGDGSRSAHQVRRKSRHPFIMITMIVASVLLGWLFLDDLLFLLQKDNNVDLGKTDNYYGKELDGRKGLAEEYRHNTWVTVSGFAVHAARSDNGKMIFKLAYVPVLVSVTEKPDQFMLDWVHYSTSGRLVDLDSSKKYGGLGAWYRKNHKLDTSGYFLLLADDKPADYWYVPIVYLALAVIAIFNLIGLIKWSLRNR